MPDGFEPDRGVLPALEARGVRAQFAVWDDTSVPWDEFDLVVVRHPYDYARRRDAFLTWAEALAERVQNPAPVLRWNTDKRYLTELAEAGVPVVPTTFVAPTDPAPELEGEVVVKPSVSAGSRDTGRFGPAAHGQALELVERIGRSGRAAMVQPYLEGVDSTGETALVFIAGELSHVLRKRPVLRPDEVAPTADDQIGAALAMYDDQLVAPSQAGDAQRELAQNLIGWLRTRFGATPLYARVDLVPGADGSPVLLELEVTEPALYLAFAPGSAERLAGAILGCLQSVPDGEK
jgi:hypothetical protein